MQLSHLVQLGLFDFIFGPIAQLFGWLTSLLYEFFGNFGLAIIFMTIIVRGLTMPLNVRSAKAMMKQQTLADKQAAIKRKYADDKQKQDEEMQKLLQENGISTFSGCLVPLLPIFFLFPTYYIVRCPLQYIMGVSRSNIKQIGEILNISGVVEDNISLITRLQNDGAAMSSVVKRGLITAQQIPDMKFLGMDLGKKPSFNPGTIAKEPSIYLPLLIIPALVLLTTLLQNYLMAATRADAKKRKEDKERAKNNPAFNAPDDPAARTTKIMNIIMPAFMLATTFWLPAAFGFYWIVGNLMGVIQTILTYYMFNKPYEEKKKELLEKKKMVFKKKQKLEAQASGNASGKSGKNKK